MSGPLDASRLTTVRDAVGDALPDYLRDLEALVNDCGSYAVGVNRVADWVSGIRERSARRGTAVTGLAIP
jgi:Arc/MetJ family transcription regulator